ncbi:ABC transporter ATP-binding protein [Geobacter sp.]|uniref:ABC transporter ATP-binding protein n=1 Tax=Geobacter sp. TaxID=46610 RepID=UPI001AC0DD66|nr:ABC transporter ATP-binding protein [Geobacter sp.]CAG0930048.1 sulfonate transport system ATP-binding protein [Rhodocyclaceae bacterium]
MVGGSVGDKLVIEGLHKSYPVRTGEVTALEDINLTIGNGEFIAIVGASGCGKSTLLRIIAGLENGYDGTVRLGDRRIAGPGLDRGMVFQEHRLLPWLTVEQNVAFGLNGLVPGEKERLVREHLDLVGLTGFARVHPHQLSGGMAQRVAIARALVNQPGLLLLDEPFGALDALTKIQMQQEILRIWEVERTTMVLVTHDIDEAIYLGDRVVIMSSRPGTVKRIVPVNLPRPRDRTSYEFVEIRREIYAEFFAEAERPFAYAI